MAHQADQQTMQLVLIRHGESEWNKLNLFTGWTDVELTDTGREEAAAGGRVLKEAGFDFDVCYTSRLKRAIPTPRSNTVMSRPISCPIPSASRTRSPAPGLISKTRFAPRCSPASAYSSPHTATPCAHSS